MRIIKTTDNRFIGTVIEEVSKDDVIELEDFKFNVQQIVNKGIYTTISNSNYIIKLKS